jgi:outer membrane immunogenic protein
LGQFLLLLSHSLFESTTSRPVILAFTDVPELKPQPSRTGGREPMRNILAIATAAALGFSAWQTASAADLPVKARPAPVAPAAPVAWWTGCYIGGNLGGSWGSGDISDTAGVVSRSGSNSGFTGGGQIGCDVQAGAFVFGIRDMFDWSNRSRTAVIENGGPFDGYSVELKNRWVDLLTGRVGYAVQPQWLLYFQGGAAWRDASLRAFDPTGVQVLDAGRTRTGWTIGGGAEYMFAPNFSGFLEYDYADFGSKSATFATAAGTDTITAKSNVQMLLVGLNWRWGAAAMQRY